MRSSVAALLFAWAICAFCETFASAEFSGTGQRRYGRIDPTGKNSEDSRVCFNSLDNGMAWPMAEFENNPMRSVAHGVHCLEMQNDFNKGADVTDPLLLVHIVHCNNVLTKMLADMTANRYKYETTNAVCNFVGNPPQRVKRLTGWFKYGGRRKRAVSTGVIRIQPTINGSDYVQPAYESQNEAFAIMGAENFGRLIIKHFYDPSLMSPDEQRYMRFTHSEIATFLGGLDVVCTHGVNFDRALAAVHRVVSETNSRGWTSEATIKKARVDLDQMLGRGTSAEKLANLKNLLSQIKIDLTGDEPEETEEPLKLDTDFEAAARRQSLPLDCSPISNEQLIIYLIAAFTAGSLVSILVLVAVMICREKLTNRYRRLRVKGQDNKPVVNTYSVAKPAKLPKNDGAV